MALICAVPITLPWKSVHTIESSASGKHSNGQDIQYYYTLPTYSGINSLGIGTTYEIHNLKKMQNKNGVKTQHFCQSLLTQPCTANSIFTQNVNRLGHERIRITNADTIRTRQHFIRFNILYNVNSVQHSVQLLCSPRCFHWRVRATPHQRQL